MDGVGWRVEINSTLVSGADTTLGENSYQRLVVRESAIDSNVTARPRYRGVVSEIRCDCANLKNKEWIKLLPFRIIGNEVSRLSREDERYARV